MMYIFEWSLVWKWKLFWCSADYGTLPTLEEIFGRTRGMVSSTQGLNYNSKTLLICFAKWGFLHLVGCAESSRPWENCNHLQAWSFLPETIAVTIWERSWVVFDLSNDWSSDIKSGYWFFFRARGLCLSWTCNWKIRASFSWVDFLVFPSQWWFKVFLSSGMVPTRPRVAISPQLQLETIACKDLPSFRLD